MVATPTDRQWWAMCDVNMSHPNPLHKADLTSPFVYERGFGLCYVPMGCHQSAMALLLAFQHGLYRRMEVVELLNLNDLSDRSEEHTSELQSLIRISYAAFCLKKQINKIYLILTNTVLE